MRALCLSYWDITNITSCGILLVNISNVRNSEFCINPQQQRTQCPWQCCCDM